MRILHLVDTETVKREIQLYMRDSLTPNEDKIIGIIDRNTFVTYERMKK